MFIYTRLTPLASLETILVPNVNKTSLHNLYYRGKFQDSIMVISFGEHDRVKLLISFLRIS